jgi:RNA polymerase sigma factor (sigma-70 family)
MVNWSTFLKYFTTLSEKITLLSEKHTGQDTALWSELKKGNRLAFARIYDTHIDALYNFGNKLYQNPQVVEDAIHDLFVDLWRYRDKLASVSSVRVYLYVSLRRRIVQSSKAGNVFLYDLEWDKLNLASMPEESRLVEKEGNDQQLERLKRYLNNLSPRQYEAIVLRFYDEMSYTEIATIMDVNEQSVRNLVQRGLEHLRQYSRLAIPLLLLPALASVLF